MPVNLVDRIVIGRMHDYLAIIGLCGHLVQKSEDDGGSLFSRSSVRRANDLGLT